MSEAELHLREKAGESADEIIDEVKQCPEYFWMEGGSDGTWGHMMFHEDYGHLMPYIVKFATECEKASAS